MLYDKVNYYFRKIYKFLELKFWNYISFIYFSQKNKKLKEIIHKNRKFLNAHKTFILKDEYKKNDFGIPKHIFENINKPINNLLKRDFDFYDKISDHIIIIDNNINNNENVVGTYRLLRGNFAKICKGFYTEQEFDYEIHKVRM